MKTEWIENEFPKVGRFASVKSINQFCKSRPDKSPLCVHHIGTSPGGEPVYHVKAGKGRLKVMLIGFPHPNEPIGGTTCLALMKMLERKNSTLLSWDVEWHIIPCADPDGAKLNEKWSLKPFSISRRMRFSYRQGLNEQVEWSYPLHYKGLTFKKPVHGTRMVMKVMKKVRPDFVYSLHNAKTGGAHFYLNHDYASGNYQHLYSILKSYGIPVHKGGPETPAAKKIATGVFTDLEAKKIFDHESKRTGERYKQLPHGGGGADFLMTINKKSLYMIPELPYVKTPEIDSPQLTSFSKKRLLLQTRADQIFLIHSLLEELRNIKGLNKKSPFYKVLQSFQKNQSIYVSLVEKFPDVSVGQKATLAEYQEQFEQKYWVMNLCYQAIQLFDDSPQTPTISTAKRRLKSAVKEVFESIDFPEFGVIPEATVCKAQMALGLETIRKLLLKK